MLYINDIESLGVGLSLSHSIAAHTHTVTQPLGFHPCTTRTRHSPKPLHTTDGRDEPHAARHSTLYSFLTCTLCIVPQAAPHAKSDSVPISPPHRRWCALRTHSSHRSTAQDPLSHRTQISTSPRGGRAQNSSSPHTNPSGANRRAR